MAFKGAIKVYGFMDCLNPEEPTFLKDLYQEIIIRNPKKVGSSGLRIRAWCLHSLHCGKFQVSKGLWDEDLELVIDVIMTIMW